MTETIRIIAIDPTERLRPVDPDHVALIAASIEERGLEQPIVVRPAGDGYKLTIGLHRLDAMKALGWSELTVGEHVIVREEDDLDARISEIAENLARHELNALDRALFLAERKRLDLERGQGPRRGGDRKSPKYQDKIKAPSWRIDLAARVGDEVAKRLDLSERAVQRAVRIAENLDREAIKDIRGTMVERNQQELLALVELEQEQQRSAAKEIRDGRAKTVQQARVAIGLDKPVANDPQARLLAQVAAALTKCERATLLQINELLKPLLRSRK